MKKNIKTSHFPYNTLCHPRVFLSGISTLLKKWLRLPITTLGNDSTARAFTLIELLVVVLIIGILSAIALPQYQKAVVKARLATVKSTTEAIAQAQEIYYMANGSYATKFSDLDVQAPAGGTANEEDTAITYDWGLCSLEDPVNARCGAGEPVEINYLVYYSKSGISIAGRRYCQAGKGSIYEKVCQQDTGKKTCPYWGSGSTVATCIYE